MYKYEDYLKNAELVKERIGDFVPEYLIILGSGLGALAEEVEEPVYIEYNLNTHVHSTYAPGHKGRLVFGKLAGKNVCIMQGRLHFYEGYSAEQVAFPIRLFYLLGTKKVILTNAAGCINTDWSVGDIMIIEDHIRLSGVSPLTGENIDFFGPRFNDMTQTYSKRMIKLAEDTAKKMDINIRKGVYMFFAGPQFETPAEIRAARILGGDAAGMSTVPEATFARHCGMETLGLSMLSNMAAGITGEELSGDEVLQQDVDYYAIFNNLVKNILRNDNE